LRRSAACASTSTIHHWAGIALVLGFAAHFVYCLHTYWRRAPRTRPRRRTRRPLGGDLKLPMVVHPRDLLKGHHLLLYLCGLRREPPSFGRFSIKKNSSTSACSGARRCWGSPGALLWGEQILPHLAAAS
jgi:hypothetical protein